MEDKIRLNAALVVEQMGPLCGFEFGYDERSVAWLDGYIERQRARPDATAELFDGLTNVLGSYLGECIVRCYGGRWENDGGQWRVSFSDGNAAYPFAKVRKQFEHGAGDSIESFFRVIPVIFADHADAPAGADEPARKPWWKLW